MEHSVHSSAESVYIRPVGTAPYDGSKGPSIHSDTFSSDIAGSSPSGHEASVGNSYSSSGEAVVDPNESYVAE